MVFGGRKSWNSRTSTAETQKMPRAIADRLNLWPEVRYFGSAAFLPHIEQRAVFRRRDLLQRVVKLAAAVASARGKHIPGQAFGVNANERRIRAAGGAMYQSDMMLVRGFIQI